MLFAVAAAVASAAADIIGLVVMMLVMVMIIAIIAMSRARFVSTCLLNPVLSSRIHRRNNVRCGSTKFRGEDRAVRHLLAEQRRIPLRLEIEI